MRGAGGRHRALGVLGVALLGVGSVVAPASASVSEYGPPLADDETTHVIVVGVADLRWTDVSADRTPTLARIAQRGSVGTLSVRSAPEPPQVTCPGEGWLTLSAGTYAAIRHPNEISAASGCDQRQPPAVEVDAAPDGSLGGRPAGRGANVSGMPELYRLNASLRFGARPGSLGDAVSCGAAIGPGAALAVADRHGRVDAYTASLPSDPSRLLVACPLTAVDLGVLPTGVERHRALMDFDSALTRVDRYRPPNSVLVVVGLAEVGGQQPRLHLAAATGGGFAGGWLCSSSTRRVPYVQLSDLAPTAIGLVGGRASPTMAGRPITSCGTDRPADLMEATRALTDTDAAATAHRTVTATFFIGFGILSLLVYTMLGWLLWRHGRASVRTAVATHTNTKPTSPFTLRRLGLIATALAAVPGCTFTANMLPWWRSPWPLLALVGAVLFLAAVTVMVGYAGPWRRKAGGPVAAVAAVTLLVGAVDALSGTTLQINSLLGYNPLVAGRFIGFGNIAFAIFGAAVMLLTAAFAARVSRRRAALGVVVAMAVPTVILDGAPTLGADFGGVLTLVPAFVVLAMLVTGGRIRVLPVLLGCAGGALLVGAVSFADYLRPDEYRSHFGWFAASVLDGTAGESIERKLLANVNLLFAGPHTLAALALVVALTAVVFRPPKSLWVAYAEVPSLRNGLVAVVALAWLGFATNDSGVAIPVVAMLVAVPAALAVCARVAASPACRSAQLSAAAMPAGQETPVPPGM